MIIKLVTGGYWENLALTPVVREVFIRYSGKKRARIETACPDVWRDNPFVEGAVEFVHSENEPVIDLDVVEWPKSSKSIIESYAEAVLGDSRLSERQMRLYPDFSAERKDKLVVLGFRGKAGVPEAVRADVRRELVGNGFWVSEPVLGDIRRYRDIVASASLYVGLASDETWVACCTDTPIVACLGWLDPVWVRPFRRGVPFVTVGNPCKDMRCASEKVLSEFGVVYGVDCADRVCESGVTAAMFLPAINKALALCGEACRCQTSR